MNKKISETGRSMTEMLGVLAIVGVLSITALGGYRYAMNSYYTNSIIDGMNKRMVVAVEQQAQGNEDVSSWLSEFDNKIIARFPVAATRYSSVILSYFNVPAIEVSGIPEGVCKMLQDVQYSVDYTALINNNRPRLSTCQPDTDTGGQNSLHFILSLYLVISPFPTPRRLFSVPRQGREWKQALISVRHDKGAKAKTVFPSSTDNQETPLVHQAI